MRIGLLTVENPRARTATVFMDGEDVTARCFAADDKQGWVGLYRLNADGQKYLIWPVCGHDVRVPGCLCETFQQQPAVEVRTGAVEIRLGGAA